MKYLLSLSLIICNIFIYSAKCQSITEEDLGVIIDSTVNIKLGCTTNNIKKILGNNYKSEKFANQFGGGTNLHWTYKHIKLLFYNNTLTSITLLTPAYSTLKGIKVGDKAVNVVEKYGTPSSKYQDDWEYYDDPEYPYNKIIFKIRNGEIKEIFIGSFSD